MINNTPIVSSVASVEASEKDILQSALQRRQRLLQMREHTIEKLAREQGEAENTVTDEHFAGATDNAIAQEVSTTEQSIKALYQKAMDGINDAGEISDRLRYLISEDIDYLLLALDNGAQKKKSITNLVDNLENSSESAFETLEAYLLNECKSVAEIYLTICYIREVLQQRKIRKDFQQYLKQLIKKYEEQQSAYLCEFFKLQKFFKSDRSSIKFFDGLAKLSSGHLSVTSIKQVLYFIRDTLDGDFTALISNYMKLRAQQLKILTTNQSLQFEQRTQLVDLIKTEKYFLIVNSMYHLSKEFLEGLKEANFTVRENYHDLLWQVVSLVESVYVSELNINNLGKSINIMQMNDKQSIAFLHRLQNLLRKMPQELFQADGKDKQKRIFEGVFSILAKKSQQARDADSKNHLVPNLERYSKSTLLDFV